VRVVNLVAFAGCVGDELGRLAGTRPESPTEPQAGAESPDQPRAQHAEAVGRLLQRIRHGARQVEDICGGADAHGGAQAPAGPAALPVSLPAPSRRAYQWLKFLSDEGRLREHLEALRLLAGMARETAGVLGRIAALAGRSVRVDLYHSKTLYRIRSGRDGLCLTISEGFLTAPVDVLEGLVRLALGHGREAGRVAGRGGGRRGHRVRRGGAGDGQRAADLARLREYSRGQEFRGIVAAIERNGGPVALPPTRGRHYDLETVFERVNTAYFGGRLARPVLTWNTVVTRRKVGHYEPATDTVMLSLTLDDAAVPEGVVDFIMYHELLHKHFGITVVNGRQRAHTPAFRQAEKRFPHYAQAQAFLGWVGRRRRAAAPSRRSRDQAGVRRRKRQA
jgi:hypothetical protein